MKRTARLIVLFAYAVLALAISPHAAAEDFGITTVQGSDLEIKDIPLATQVLLLADGDLQSITAYIKGKNNIDFRVAIYDDSAGSIGTLLAESSAIDSGPTSWHWATTSMPSTSLTAGTYWLAICFDEDKQYIKYTTSGGTGSTSKEREAVTIGFQDPWKQNSTNTYTLSLYATTAASGPTVTSFVTVETTLSLSGSTGIGTYGTDPVVVATNSTANNNLSLSGSSTIQGDSYVGVGGDTNTVINISGTASITGTTGTLSSTATIPNPSEPSVGGGATAQSFSSGITTINSDVHASSWTMSGTGIVQITGNVTILVENDFTMTGDSRIQLSDSASLSIYVKGNIDIQGDAAINAVNANPSAVALVTLGTGTFDITGNAQVYSNSIAHDTQLSMNNTARLYGSFQGDSLQMQGSSWIYGSAPGVSVANPTPRITQWQEIDPN